jgi:hypothetical protein
MGAHCIRHCTKGRNLHRECAMDRLVGLDGTRHRCGAVIPETSEQCAALLASFGAPDDVILDIVFGRFNPCGKLPIEMPRRMEAVRAQKEDPPYDSENPLYPFGYGLSYD